MGDSKATSSCAEGQLPPTKIITALLACRSPDTRIPSTQVAAVTHSFTVRLFLYLLVEVFHLWVAGHLKLIEPSIAETRRTNSPSGSLLVMVSKATSVFTHWLSDPCILTLGDME